MARKARRETKRKPVCRCDCNYEVSTVQEDEYHAHRIVLVCEECERTYRLQEAFGDILPDSVMADLIIKATTPR